MIKAHGVHKTYGAGTLEVHALNSVSIEVNEGEMVAIMGPSGCGKTTLLNCLSGLDSIDAGEVFIDDREIQTLSDDQMSDFRARFMGFVFQTFNLLPVLTAQENVEMPLLVSGVSPKEAAEKAFRQLEFIGLPDRAAHKPAELSVGQRQRVAIARALVNDPAIIWADEPTGNLDSQTENEVMDLILQLNKETKQTIMLVTHSEEVGARADRIVRMQDGEIIN
ncbi:MAG: ABC transporter ATP-binding protein [SAR202 cluster bacterium]|nr:ABC transporter ATP-binding protein [SAR202 cluster bacterium]|tara:strand:+ start:7797 stop:8462 length:666 start_codon:yes stop_codon:yes gene_type:complete